MPGNAGVQIHVECGSDGSPGLDGDDIAMLWISYKFPGEDRKVIATPLVPRDLKGKGESGDDAIAVATNINNSLGGRGSVSTKSKTTPTPRGTRGNPNIRKITNTWARVDFTGIEEIDAACCHGKVSVSIYGEVFNPPGRAKAPVTISPVEVLLNDKQELKYNKKCPGLREPVDPDPPPRPPRPTTPPPKGTPPPPPPPVPPPTTPPDVPWVPVTPLVIAPPPTTQPPSLPPAPPQPKDGDQPKEGEEKQQILNDDTLAMGFCRLWCGTAPRAPDIIEVTVPWRIIRTSPQRQLEHIAACLEVAGIVCVSIGARLFISHHRDTRAPIIAFEFGANLAGVDFPWHWSIWLWREPVDHAAPPFVSAPQALFKFEVLEPVGEGLSAAEPLVASDSTSSQRLARSPISGRIIVPTPRSTPVVPSALNEVRRRTPQSDGSSDTFAGPGGAVPPGLRGPGR
jgi:hypothetical protein